MELNKENTHRFKKKNSLYSLPFPYYPFVQDQSLGFAFAYLKERVAPDLDALGDI